LPAQAEGSVPFIAKLTSDMFASLENAPLSAQEIGSSPAQAPCVICN